MEATQGAGIDFTGLLGSMLHTLIEPVTGKPGGYSDNIFLNLSEEEKENSSCNICFLIVKDARECPNHHLFCASCIFRWSMSGGATNSRCPVCRTEGRYKPEAEIEKILSKKHVKCPQTECPWAGKLQDFRWHSKSHGNSDDEDSLELPVISPRTGNVRNSNENEFPTSGASSRQRLEHLMEAFHERLQQRRLEIERYQQERERQRQESMEEVEHLGRHLGDVSNNLMHLLDNMHQDSQRYQEYVNEAQRILPSTMNSNGHNYSPTPDEARVERILASPTPASNPFIIPSEFRTPPRSIYGVRPPLMNLSQQNARPRGGQSQLHSRTSRMTSRPSQLSRSRIRPNYSRNGQNT